MKNQKTNLFFTLNLFFATALTLYLVKTFNLELNPSILYSYWQYLDIQNLIEDPFNSILYLHSQPPMLNILIKIFSLFGEERIFEIFVVFNSLCIGLTSSIIFKIISERTRSIKIGIIFSFLYIIFPSTMLNAGYAFYPAMTACMYSLLILSFHLVNAKPKIAIFILSFSIILLSTTRGSFTILHTIFFYLLFAYLYHKSFRQTYLIQILGVLVLLLSSAFSIKNLALYNFYGNSSWSPINIAYGVGIPRDEWYWMSPEEIKKIYPNLKCENSYHFQDTSLLKSSGHANYNHCLMIEHGKIIASESFKQYEPLIHAKYFLSNSAYYFAPSDMYRELTSRKNIKTYADFINSLQLTVNISEKHQIRVLLILLLLVAAFILFKRKDIFLSVCMITIVSHYFSHAVTDGYESQRFVFDIEFIFFIIFAIVFWSGMKTNHLQHR